MTTLTQEDFNTAREVMEHMSASMQTHEPYAVNSIETIENALAENSFELADYPE